LTNLGSISPWREIKIYTLLFFQLIFAPFTPTSSFSSFTFTRFLKLFFNAIIFYFSSVIFLGSFWTFSSLLISITTSSFSLYFPFSLWIIHTLAFSKYFWNSPWNANERNAPYDPFVLVLGPWCEGFGPNLDFWTNQTTIMNWDL
jgi:hypothetical protein